MVRLKRLYARLRWRNLIGVHFYTWFRENGVETRREYWVLSRSKQGGDTWTVRTDMGSLFYGHGGKFIRQCLVEKVVIEM